MKMSRIYTIISLLFIAVSGIGAQDRMQIDDFNVAPGKSRQINVALTNSASYTGFQADIELPNNLSLSTTDGEAEISLTSRADDTHMLVTNQLSEKLWRVVCFSIENIPFNGTEGELMNIKISTTQQFAGGEIVLKNIIFTNEQNQDVVFENTTATVGVHEQNTLSVSPLQITQEGEYEVTISLNNDTEFTAFQTEIILPSELTIIDGSFKLTDRATTSHKLSTQLFGNNKARVVVTSMSNATINNCKGAILTFKVEPQSGVSKEGEIILQNNYFSDASANEYKLPNTSATVIISTSVKYTVSVSATQGGTAEASATEVEEGATVTLTATPNDGYKFTNWTLGGEVVSTENPYQATITANTEFVANFEVLPTSGKFEAVNSDGVTIWYNITSYNTAEVTYKGSSYYEYSGEYSGEVNIPSTVEYSGNTYSVTTIGNYAFSECDGLTSVVIPESVTTIGKSAFSNCDVLTSVVIPESVTSIGTYPFLGCKGLTEIEVAEGNINYSSEDGVLFNKDKTELIKYPIGNSRTSYSIPEGVTWIETYAFYDCKGLTSVTILESVTSIGSYAFKDCDGLTEIEVAEGNINYSSEDGVLFNKDKTKLIQYPIGNSRTSYSIPEGVTSIGYDAFYNCNGLTSVTIPNSVTTIGESAFGNCNGLTSVTIPEGVTSIGNYAFDACTGLTSVTIPEGVTTIGYLAFDSCYGLTEIEVAEGNINYSSEDGVLFNKDKTELIKYPIGNSRTSYSIPESVTTIRYRAFYYCKGLTSVVIPEGVTTIGDWAFSYCDGLTEIYSLNPVAPTIYSYTFYKVPKTILVYIPKGSLSSYQSAEYWSEFTNFVEIKEIYSISVSSSDESMGSATASETEVEEGATVTLTATPNDGYKFTNWTLGGEVVSTDNPYTATITENTEFVANFEEFIPVYCSVTGNMSNWRRLDSFAITDGISNLQVTSIQPTTTSPVTVDKTDSVLETQAGSTIYFTEYYWPWEWMHSYAYIDYNKDGVFNTTLNIDGTTRGELVSYNYYNGKDSHGNSANQQHANTNTYSGSAGLPSFTLPSNMHEGTYRLRIKVDWNNLDPCGASDIKAYGGCICDITLKIVPVIPERTISVSVNQEETGTVTINGEEVASATAEGRITLQATPAEGYKFVNWTLNGEEVSTSAKFVDGTEGDKAYVANFIPKPKYNVSVSVNDAAMGTAVATAEGEVYEGTEVTLTATPNDGYEFVNWTVNGEVVSTTNPYTATVTANTEFVANFQIIPTKLALVAAECSMAHYSSYTADKMIDGAYNTYYDSSPKQTNEATVTVTLDKVSTIGDVKIYFKNNYYPTKAKIQVSTDGDVWNDVEGGEFAGADALDASSVQSGAKLITVNCNCVVAKYVRMFITEPGSSWLTINEFEVYEAPVNVAPRTISVSVNDDTMGSAYVGAAGMTEVTNQTARVKVVATPASNAYRFVNWTVEGEVVSTNSTFVDRTEGDKAYVANFEAKPIYEVSVSVNDEAMGMVEASAEGEIIEGTPITLTATPNAGSIFINWTVNGEVVSTENPYTVTITANTEFVANLVEKVENGYENGHEYVDLGLPSGIKWATCNVGATTPEEYGDYFAWGETEPKTSYSWSNYKYCNGSDTTMTKYCTSSDYGTIDNKTVLELEDDAARVNWGGNWRMPTFAEQKELVNTNNCTWEWTTQNGVNGYKVTSVVNGNSIFLPAAGYRSNSSLDSEGRYGYYWSSSLDTSSSDYAYYVAFRSGAVGRGHNYRYQGQSVRAVWKPVYTVSVSATEGGTVETSATEVEEGATVTLTATPNAGYVFVNWTVNGEVVSSENPYIATVTANTEYIANFGYPLSEPTGTENGYGYVDLALPSGLKWATYNVGATSPEEYGDYFAWGETQPKDNYYWDSYKYCNGSYDTMTKYCTSSSYGTVDNKTTLELTDDAAHVNWGGNWRMPTKAEQDELRNTNNCTWEWTTQNGVNGYKVTSVVNGNSIFLPAAGFRCNGYLSSAGSLGYYWSSSLSTSHSYFAYDVFFSSSYVSLGSIYRCYGQSVRAVCESSTPAPTPIVCTVSVSATEGGTAEASATEVENGDEVTLTATPAPGYAFVNWTVNGEVVSTENPYTATVTADTEFVANFEEFIPEYVDLGLPSGIKWATCNVGATSPEGYGNYFAWGETKPKTAYDWSTYKYCNGSNTTMTKYCTDSIYGTIDNKTVLELDDDVARVLWGGNWRMPTRAEEDELRDTNNCTWTWTTQNGVNGYKVTSNVNGNSIFLPAAGYRYYDSIYDAGTYGFYWSSSLFKSNSYSACYLDFGSVTMDWAYNSRFYGLSVRAVSAPLYLVSVSATEGGTAEASSTEVEGGAVVTLTATPAPGYNFVNWTVNGEVVSSENPYIATVTAPTEYVANFEEGEKSELNINKTNSSSEATVVVKTDAPATIKVGDDTYTATEENNLTVIITIGTTQSQDVKIETIGGQITSVDCIDNTNVEKLPASVTEVTLRNVEASEVVLDAPSLEKITIVSDASEKVAKVSTKSNLSQGVQVVVEKEINTPKPRPGMGTPTIFNFLSMPFDFNTDSIKYWDLDSCKWMPAVLESNIRILMYKSNLRANKDYKNTWETLKSAREIHANQGFVVVGSNKYGDKVNYKMILKFTSSPKAYDGSVTSVTANRYRKSSGDTYVGDKDWNFNGVPFLTSGKYPDDYTLYTYDNINLGWVEHIPALGLPTLQPYSSVMYQAKIEGMDMTKDIAIASSSVLNEVKATDDVFARAYISIDDTNPAKIVLSDESSENFVVNEDAWYMGSLNNTTAEAYFNIQGSEAKVTVQPAASELAMTVYTGVGTEHRITLTTIDGNYDVYLRDVATDKVVCLNDEDYTFSAAAKTTIANRFVVSMVELTGICDQAKADGTIKAVVAGDVIKLYGTEEGEQISLYTANGMVIANAVAEDGVTTIATSATGVVIIKVADKVAKVIVK